MAQTITCDICGDVIQGKIKYFEMYELDGDHSTPLMPIQEMCAICMDSLRNHFKGAAIKDKVDRLPTSNGGAA